MLLIVGTVPNPSMPLVHGRVRLKNGELLVENHRLAVGRGTPALAAAAAAALTPLGHHEVFVILAGDIGQGNGSRAVYQYLVKTIRSLPVDVLVFHYLLPDVDWHNKVLFAIDEMPRRPRLIADAGFMYAAKMSGQASVYDFFTPDKGELAFLADKDAPHPFYTRGFLLHNNHSVADLVHQAYAHGDAPRWLVVKGETDHIADSGHIVAKVSEPLWEPLEAIGGTGDTLTGILATLCAARHDPLDACLLAALTNRWIGHIARPTPATQIAEFMGALPEALFEAQRAMERESKRGKR